MKQAALLLLLLIPAAHAAMVTPTLTGAGIDTEGVEEVVFIDGQEAYAGNATHHITLAPGWHDWNTTAENGRFYVDNVTAALAPLTAAVGNLSDEQLQSLLDALLPPLNDALAGQDALSLELSTGLPTDYATKTDVSSVGTAVGNTLKASDWTTWSATNAETLAKQKAMIEAQAKDAKSLKIGMGFVAVIALAAAGFALYMAWHLQSKRSEQSQQYLLVCSYLLALARVSGVEGSPQLEEARAELGLPPIAENEEAIEAALNREAPGGKVDA